MIGASDDDCKLLIMKRFLITFDSGVIVIKHWKIHNYIQKDRYKETMYKEEKQQLQLNENNAYTLSDTPCIQDVSMLDTQVRLGKDSIELDKDSIEVVEVSEEKPKVKRFIPPTLEQVQEYCKSRNNNVDAEHFVDYYTANGWLVGKNKMKDWKAAVRTWERNNFSNNNKSGKVYGKNGIEIDPNKEDDLAGIF